MGRFRKLWKVILKRIFPEQKQKDYGDANPRGFVTKYQGVKMSSEEFNEHFRKTYSNAKKLHNLDSSDYIKSPTTRSLN